jgi:hypothetical protein
MQLMNRKPVTSGQEPEWNREMVNNTRNMQPSDKVTLIRVVTQPYVPLTAVFTRLPTAEYGTQPVLYTAVSNAHFQTNGTVTGPV